jgi:hypothetical protein
MTVNELVAHLQQLQQQGLGNRCVEMGDPQTQCYEEVTGIWIPDATDESVYLESVSWTTFVSVHDDDPTHD